MTEHIQQIDGAWRSAIAAIRDGSPADARARRAQIAAMRFRGCAPDEAPKLLRRQRAAVDSIDMMVKGVTSCFPPVL